MYGYTELPDVLLNQSLFGMHCMPFLCVQLTADVSTILGCLIKMTIITIKKQ